MKSLRGCGQQRRSSPFGPRGDAQFETRASAWARPCGSSGRRPLQRRVVGRRAMSRGVVVKIDCTMGSGARVVEVLPSIRVIDDGHRAGVRVGAVLVCDRLRVTGASPCSRREAAIGRGRHCANASRKHHSVNRSSDAGLTRIPAACVGTIRRFVRPRKPSAATASAMRQRCIEAAGAAIVGRNLSEGGPRANRPKIVRIPPQSRLLYHSDRRARLSPAADTAPKSSQAVHQQK